MNAAALPAPDARNLRDAGFKPECYKSPKGEEFVGLAAVVGGDGHADA